MSIDKQCLHYAERNSHLLIQPTFEVASISPGVFKGYYQEACQAGWGAMQYLIRQAGVDILSYSSEDNVDVSHRLARDNSKQ